MMTSMSNSPYRRIAIVIAMGNPSTASPPDTSPTTAVIVASVPNAARSTLNTTWDATNSPAKNPTHLICCRSTRSPERNRTTSATTAAANMRAETAASPGSVPNGFARMASTPSGFSYVNEMPTPAGSATWRGSRMKLTRPTAVAATAERDMSSVAARRRSAPLVLDRSTLAISGSIRTRAPCVSGPTSIPQDGGRGVGASTTSLAIAGLRRRGVTTHTADHSGARGETRPPTASRPPDPKSGASASSATLASGAGDHIVMLGERRVRAVRTILPDREDQLVHVGRLREVERPGQRVGLCVSLRQRCDPVDVLDEPQYGGELVRVMIDRAALRVGAAPGPRRHDQGGRPCSEAHDVVLRWVDVVVEAAEVVPDHHDRRRSPVRALLEGVHHR